MRVNNVRHEEGVPTLNTDWWNYGGITRDVLLVDEPATFIANFLVRLKPGMTNAIEARVQLDGPDRDKVRESQLPITEPGRRNDCGSERLGARRTGRAEPPLVVARKSAS